VRRKGNETSSEMTVVGKAQPRITDDVDDGVMHTIKTSDNQE
jgi:hypothetical protein